MQHSQETQSVHTEDLVELISVTEDEQPQMIDTLENHEDLERAAAVAEANEGLQAAHDSMVGRKRDTKAEAKKFRLVGLGFFLTYP